MKRDWINIKISTQYLDENDEWQDVTISCRARRNEYFNPITEPYEPFLDIENFRCAEYDWLGCEVFEDEITEAFYEAEADGLTYWENTQEIAAVPVFEMAA